MSIASSPPFEPARPAIAATILATAAIGGMVLPVAAASAEPAAITVYTIRAVPVSGTADATVILLDTASEIEETLSTGLPDDPARAVAVARQRILDGGVALQRKLQAAYEPIAEAWSLGITTLPAVVVDRRYVIYGEPEVANAVARIEAFRRERP